MPSRESLKLIAARGMDALGMTRGLAAIRRGLLGGRFIRAVNYHGTPQHMAPGFRRQLEFFAQHYSAVTLEDLRGLLHDGRWNKPRPGLLISFDDGLRSNYEIAAPLLEEFGFCGWFFVPTDFVDCPPAEQGRFAQAHSIHIDSTSRAADGRGAMSWDEVRRLDGRHVIGCHTCTHCRLTAEVPEAQLRREIVDSKKILEQALGHEVEVFCWVGGEERAYTAAAAALIREAGYGFSFATCSSPLRSGTNPLQLHRTNLEANWPLSLVRFQLCGVADWFNRGKRARVNRVLS